MNHDPRSPSSLARLTDPAEVLGEVAARLDRLALISALGPQTLVVIDLLHRMGADIPVLMLDTGLLFPETYALRLRLQARYGIRIRAVTADLTLEAQAQEHGEALWERAPDRCCAMRKTQPLRTVLADLDGWITGLRRDQGPTRAHTETVAWDARHGLWKVSPLAHWSRDQVFAYLRAHDVPTNPLLDRGFRSVGCMPCTRAATPDDDPTDERAGRWAGSEKTECGLHWDRPRAVDTPTNEEPLR